MRAAKLKDLSYTVEKLCQRGLLEAMSLVLRNQYAEGYLKKVITASGQTWLEGCYD